MKWIIEGRAYNTLTSTRIARYTWDHNSVGLNQGENTLYQTKSGVFFALQIEVVRSKDRSGEWTAHENYLVEVLSKEHAIAWLEMNEHQLFSSILGEPPEA